MKVLVVGSGGMLAQDVLAELKGSCEIAALDVPDIDIRDEHNVVEAVTQVQPDFVVNCAAYTDVDGCETQEDLAFGVNADGAKHLALACRQTGSTLCHISTDFVFDGKKKQPYVETDTVNPVSVYARSKARGEEYVQSILPQHLIIRTAWLFGRGGNNFVATILKLSQEHEQIRIVDDQAGCPTYTLDLARSVKALLAKPGQGIYHACNGGACTWYDFAVKIVSLSGNNTEVIPISTQELARPAVRPAYSAMACSKLEAHTGLRMRSWQEALTEYLAGV